MAFDYSNILATAQRLVTDFGRAITAERFDQNSSDANQPWIGPTNSSASPDATETTTGVSVSPSGADKLGIAVKDDDLMKRIESFYIVAHKSQALETFNEIIDGSERYKIVHVEKLQPGSTVLLYFIGVER